MTNDELLVELQNRRDALVTQLEALDNAIIGLGGQVNDRPAEPSKARKARTTAPASQTAATTSSSAARGRKKTVTRAGKPLEIPSEYRPSLTWKQKIAYLLKENGPLITNDIAAKVLAKEPGLDMEKTTAAVRIAASDLKKKGQLNYQQQGNAFKYELPK